MCGMTLDELIENLTDRRENEGAGKMEVMMTADYGNHSHTIQALPIRSIEQSALVESAYSNSGLALKDDEYELAEDEEPRIALTLLR